MRTTPLALLALAGLLLASVPASADVTVHEPLPSGCRGTYGVQAGPWGEAWVGSGHPTASGPCYLHVFLDTPTATQAASPDRCVELEWDTGATQYVCALHGGECGLLEAGEYGPGSPGYEFACVDDDITALVAASSAN